MRSAWEWCQLIDREDDIERVIKAAQADAHAAGRQEGLMEAAVGLEVEARDLNEEALQYATCGDPDLATMVHRFEKTLRQMANGLRKLATDGDGEGK